MKKILVLLCICGSLSATYAQKAILGKINGERGLSKPFTQLNPAEQINFSPANARSLFGLDPNSDLVLIRAESDKLGMNHYRFYQSYNNIPVENSMYIAHTKAGKLTSMSGTIVTQFKAATSQRATVAISPSHALTAALNFVNARKYAWQDANFEQRIKLRKGSNATYYPVPTKVWYGGDDQIDAANLVLAYKIDVYTLVPLDRKFIYVDARTGKILGTKQEMMHSDATGTAATGYSGTQTIHSDLNGSSYRLRDLTKGNGIITLHAATGHADYTNASANWALTGADKWALDAHYGVAATWTYYKNNFNRNSIDNAGYALTSWVNDAANTDNADWDGSEMDFGNLSSNGNGVTGIDVTGHELTHGVTQYTCNLVYSKEPGAMNESMSDIMGKSVQFYTKPADNSWILSNDMNWEIRSFANPKADGQPNTYKGTNWVTSSTDNYGVHTNSGVGNYMFYLLVTGGSGTNDIGSSYTVSGIGLAEADQIIYRTQTVYLTSTSQYANWRTACISAATDLYGATSNEVIQVENAWYAVGIGTAGGTGSSCGVPTGLAAGSITNTSAAITWTAVTGATGYTLQWKLSSASTFTTVTGITSPSYTLTGLTAGSAYQVQVSTVCSSGSSAYSSPISFTTTGTGPITYCTSVGGTLDGITNVTFNTINNTTSATTSGYTDYTSTQSTTVSQGGVYTLSVKLNTGGNYTNYAKAWIDWNHDGVFSTTTEEYNLGTAVNVASGATSLSPLTITVPAGAVIGTTRMRVSTQYNAAPTPCNASFDGEVEDYSIVITAGGPVCAVPTGLTATAITNTSATLGWTAVSGATGYNVQYKTTAGSTWTTVAASTNSLAVSGLTLGTSYQFQVSTVCSSTSSSAYSSPVSFTTTGGTVTYCASKGTTTYEYLKTVVLGTINHTVANDGGYGNYTTLSTNLTAGTAYTISITPGFASSSYTEYYTVYIDYNHDGTLNGTGEVVATGSGTGTGAKTFTFTVPATAKNGSTRLRIQMSYGSASTNPCATITYGDVHDYSVNIAGGSGFNAPEFTSAIPSKALSGISVYPNPITGPATVNYTLANEGAVIIRVVDAFGRTVQSINLGNQSKGSHNYAMSRIKQLVNGNYYIAVYQNNELVGRNKVIVIN